MCLQAIPHERQIKQLIDPSQNMVCGYVIFETEIIKKRLWRVLKAHHRHILQANHL